MKTIGFVLSLLVLSFAGLFGKEEKNGFVVGSKDVIYSDLKRGDSRESVMNKMRGAGFLQIYEERDNNLVKCALRLNGFRYELAAKLENDSLVFCLIEGQKGWQFSFFEDVVQPQWENLREKLVEKYGVKRKTSEFPDLVDVPLNDKGGYITDTWDLSDRLLILTILSFEVKDCCTNQLVEYSCCTLLIQPKVEI